MNTPILDFLESYAKSGASRLHMPGHKGEIPFDLTEITGADELFSPSGIIAESEANASLLFGSKATLYSTEGSSLCVKAMVQLISLYARENGTEPYILAYRNVHKSFVDAVALTGTELQFVYPESGDILSGKISLDTVEALITEKKPTALYITSPSYLGDLADIEGAKRLCKRHGVLLAVDNAHGAYTKFLSSFLHPLDLGADLVCDSAHKTLPVITGGAYLHIGKDAPVSLLQNAKNAMSLFATTSPSYLILASLDRANRILSDGFSKKLSECIARLDASKRKLASHGWELSGDEPLKLTLMPKSFGYLGSELAAILEEGGVFCEFFDKDHLVAMLSPYNAPSDIDRFESILLSLERKAPIKEKAPPVLRAQRVMDVRGARLSPCEKTPVELSEGKILASACESCPPAIPIMLCGEVISKECIEAFKYYGTKDVLTVKSYER